MMAERHTGTVEPQVLTEMMQLVCRLRGGIGALYDYAWQPVPFFYVHFIYLASGVYLPLAAFALARDDHMQIESCEDQRGALLGSAAGGSGPLGAFCDHDLCQRPPARGRLRGLRFP